MTEAKAQDMVRRGAHRLAAEVDDLANAVCDYDSPGPEPITRRELAQVVRGLATVIRKAEGIST